MHLRSCCFTKAILMIFFFLPFSLPSSSLNKAPCRPFHDFSIFDVDFLGKSRRHHWKERLKLGKVVKLLEGGKVY